MQGIALCGSYEEPMHHALMHFAEPSSVQASRRLKGS